MKELELNGNEPDNKELDNKSKIDNTLAYINKAWGSTCRTMLGDDIGPIEEYDKYLQKLVTTGSTVRSLLSNKEVSISGDYGEGSRFISGDEINEYSKLVEKMAGNHPLDINKIKDIDSIVEALEERFYYSGNDRLGNSDHVFDSNRVVDSTFVYKAHDVFYSKYVAYTYLAKYCDYVFGSESTGMGTHFSIKSFEIYEASRTFSCLRVYLSSDCIYSANLENCQNCPFSFNLRSKRRCIGNLQLNEDEFAKLKAKIQEDIRQDLEAHKNIITITELVGCGGG